MKCSHRKPQTYTDNLVLHKQLKREMRFGTWKTKEPDRSGSLTAAVRELARY